MTDFNQVFLNYAREDFESAKKLYAQLTDCGISVWFDERSLVISEAWKLRIKQEIENSRFFIALLSSNSVQKQGYVQEEIKEALELQKRGEKDILILPVRLDECESLYPELKDIHWVDLFPSWEEGFRKLVRRFMSPRNLKKDLEIIGFDLGHGETAVAMTTLFSTSPPAPIQINGKNSIITAMGMSQGRILIGDDAYKSTDITDLYILFKSYRLNKPEVYEPIENFVRRCLEILREQGDIQVNDEDTYFFVGSPSGWTEDDRYEYEKILRKAGMTNVTVVPESRAAFLDAKKSRDLNQSFNQLADSVLIIDIGSSTTDFTIVKNYQEKPLDFGHNNLGVGLFDRAIFEKILNSFPEAEKNKFNKLFLDKPKLKAKCLLKCRDVKEEYFSTANQDRWIDSPIIQEVEILDNRNNLFFIELYKRDIEEILNYHFPELCNKTWFDAFHDELVECQKTEEYQTPKLVLITGGGSRIRLLKDICQEIFPEAKIKIGSELNLTVAKGLALVGRTDFKIKAFRSEVDAFIASEKLLSTLKDELPKLADVIANQIFEQLLSIRIHNYLLWIEGYFDTIHEVNEQIKLEIYDLANNWFKRIKLVDWDKKLNDRIESLTQDICDKYGIPKTTFNLCIHPTKYYSLALESLEYDIKNLAVQINTSNILLDTLPISIILLNPMLSNFLGLIGLSSTLAITLLMIPFSMLSSMINKRERLFDHNINQSIEQNRAEITKQIAEELKKQLELTNLLDKFSNSIKEALNKKADEAAVIIK